MKLSFILGTLDYFRRQPNNRWRPTKILRHQLLQIDLDDVVIKEIIWLVHKFQKGTMKSYSYSL